VTSELRLGNSGSTIRNWKQLMKPIPGMNLSPPPTNSKLHSYVHRTRHILWGWRSRLHRPRPPSTSAPTSDGNTLQLAVGQSSQSEQQVLSDTLCIAGASMHNDTLGIPAKLDKTKPSIIMVTRNTFWRPIMSLISLLVSTIKFIHE
jgi:hypothetical protein